MKAISQTFLSTSRPDQAYRSTKSLFDSISRGATAYSRTMAHQGYGLGTGPMRTSQYDDRAVGPNRPEYDGVAATAAQSDSFGRSQPYADGSSFHPASSASYDLRVDNTPLLGVHNQHQSGSPGLPPYDTALPHHQTHYAQYSQASPHIGHSPQAYLPQQHLAQHPQPPLPPHQQHQHQLGMQMSGDLTDCPTLGAHMPQTSNGLHHHQPGALDAPRKGSNRADEEPHTPRPPNAWILYRSQKFREIQQSRDSQPRSGTPEKPKSQAEISRIISQMWQNESSAVKQEFEALADEKKLAHQRMYPTYRYRPKKKGKAKQSSNAQNNDQRSMLDGHGLKKRVYGFYGNGNQEDDGSEGGCSAGPSSDRKGGNEPQRTVASQGGVPSLHDLSGRDRKPSFGDRRDRNDLQVPINYGRSAFANIGSGEGHTFSYSGARMHPYADRPPRSVDVFSEAASASNTHIGSHWPESDTLSASSGSAYGDGARNGQTGYTGLGSGRLHSASLLGNNAMGGAASLLAVASPQQRSVPSQHLHSPMDHLDGSGLTLPEFTSPGAGSGFRPNPLTNHPPRFMASPFGDSRSETASGMVVTGAGSGDGLGDSFDPQRRSQNH